MLLKFSVSGTNEPPAALWRSHLLTVVKNTLYRHCHVNVQNGWTHETTLLAQRAGAVTLYNAYRFSELEDKRRKWLVFLKEK